MHNIYININRMSFFTAQFHEAMILSQLVQPGFKIIYFIFSELGHQFFKNIDHAVFGIFRFFHVFKAYTIYQVHITLVQLTKCFNIAGGHVMQHQIMITICR